MRSALSAGWTHFITRRKNVRRRRRGKIFFYPRREGRGRARTNIKLSLPGPYLPQLTWGRRQKPGLKATLSYSCFNVTYSARQYITNYRVGQPLIPDVLLFFLFESPVTNGAAQQLVRQPNRYRDRLNSFSQVACSSAWRCQGDA